MIRKGIPMISQTFQTQGLVGTFYPSATPGEKAPAVLVISGSEGGIPEYITQHLYMPEANFLALGYFGAENLPPFLEDIPLEYFIKAVEALRSMPGMDPDRIAIVGNSRGAELALLLTAKVDMGIRGVCAIVPSRYVNGGFPQLNRNAWTYEGRPVGPYLSGLTSSGVDLSEGADLGAMVEQGLAPSHEGTQKDPFIIADLFRARERKHQENLSSYEVSIEKINSSVLLLTAENDAIWPSVNYGRALIQRANDHGKMDVTHVSFVGAGHGLVFPYYEEYDTSMLHPIGKFWCHAEGAGSANRIASNEARALVSSHHG